MVLFSDFKGNISSTSLLSIMLAYMLTEKYHVDNIFFSYLISSFLKLFVEVKNRCRILPNAFTKFMAKIIKLFFLKSINMMHYITI